MRPFARIIARAARGFAQDDGTAIAGYIAFSALLGLFPFLILATNLGALFVGPQEAETLVEALFAYAPEHVALTVRPVLDDVLAGADRGLLTVSALAAVWFSSNAVEALRTAFDRAYNRAPRGFVAGRAISIVAVIIGTIVALILSVTIVFGPLLIGSFERYAGIAVSAAIGPLRLALGVGTFVVYLFFLHRSLPRHAPRRPPIWPGVLLTAAIWIAAATAFSIYLSYTPTYVSTYGTLAGVVITLMFFYITGLSLIFGAQVNAVLAQERQG